MRLAARRPSRPGATPSGGCSDEGGQKVVYLVHDGALDRECALSLLKASTLNPESIRRFQREARAMAQLQGDPHVVDVYDVGEEDGSPYLVSEFVPGGDLRSEVRACDGGLTVERVIDVARDIASALGAAHAHGIVHRDVTPGNVWLLADGRCKLGDFGLAAGADGAMTAAGGLVGTPAYMAPEQALGQACDAKSDLYSLGAVIYEMTTGRQPFVGDDPLAVVSQHINTAPVAPTWHNPSIPAALETLILALLAKAPDERPHSADAVIEALDALQSLSRDEPMAPAALNPLERLAGGVFVGREAELGELRTAVEAALAGQRQLALLAGEPGIGKTRLSEQMSTYAKLRRMSVRWGRCVEGEGAPAYWPWIQILRSLAEATDEAVLRDEAGADAGRIAQIVPELSARLGIDVVACSQRRAGAIRAVRGRRRLAKAQRRNERRSCCCSTTCTGRTSHRYCCCSILPGALRDSRVLIVGTYRDAEVDEAHPLTKLIGELPRLGESRQIALRGLSEGDVASYIELATGQAPPPRLAGAVYRQTEGNALFVTEVVRMLTASGAIDARDESWTREIPAGVRGVIGRRLGSLSEACRGVLTAAAVIGRDFELRVLERVSDAGLDAVLDALDEAMAAQLVVLAPDSSRRQGQYVFSHALVRDTLYDELASGKRLRLHARIATVLEELYGADPGPRIGALAHHFREAAADRRCLEGGGLQRPRRARRPGRYLRTKSAFASGTLQSSCSGRQGPSEQQAELLQRAADVLYLSEPSYGRGIGYLERALAIWERVGNERQQSIAHFRLGRIFTSYPEASDQPRAVRHFRAAIDRLPSDRISPMHVQAWAGLALAQDRMLVIDDALASARKARAYAEELGQENLTAIPMQLEGVCLDKKGYVREGIALEDAAWAIGERLDDPLIGFSCAWTRGFRELHYRGDPRGAIALYLRELTKPRLAEARAQQSQLAGRDRRSILLVRRCASPAVHA